MKRLISILTVLLASVLSFECENDSLRMDDLQNEDLQIITNTDKNFEVEYKTQYGIFNFESFQTNGVVTSYFRINKDGKQKLETKNQTNKNIPSYKLMVHKSVIDESTRLQGTLPTENISKNLITQFELFAKEILSNQKIDYSTDLVQVLFIHNAILNTLSRSNQDKSDCNCTPHPSYFVEKTSFWCQEDYMVDTEKFTKAIIESGLQLNSKELEVFKYLNKVKDTEKFVTIDKILEILEAKVTFMNRVETQYLIANGVSTLSSSARTQGCTQGSDLGCCGNYSGCCWVWSFACLEHDVVCHACDRWHCGWGCVKSW
jgi:hypothetical protein